MRLRLPALRRRRQAEEAPRHIAAVDARGGRFFVSPVALAPTGFWQTQDWVREVPSDADPGELGAVVVDALRRSAEGHVESDDDFAAQLRAAGVSSWSQYVKGLRAVRVERQGEETTVLPLRNRGARRGLEEIPEREEKLTEPDPRALGLAVKRGLGPELESEPAAEPRAADTLGRGAVGFGPKSAWLAVRSEQPAEVARSLGLVDVRRAPWEGVERVQRHPPEPPFPVFLPPPVEGWTLVLLTPSLAEAPFDLAALSREFGEAQKFASHRVVESQEWQRWVDGAPVRRYWWVGESGEIRLDDGEPAAAEGSLAHADDLDGDWDDLAFPDEDTVLDIAAEWSVDPTTLDGHLGLPREGLLGYLAQPPERQDQAVSRP